MGIIGSIRKHSGLAVTIVGLAIVAFIIGDLSKNNGGAPEMGKIDGQVISSQHFDMLYSEQEEQAKQQYMQYYGTSQLPAGTEYEIRDQVWQRLLQETLVGHEMDKLGISVGADELSDMYLGEFIHPYLRQVFATPNSGEYNKQYVKNVLDNFESIDSAAQVQLNKVKKEIVADRAMSKYGALISKSFYMPKAVAMKLAEVSATSSDVRVARVPYSTVSDAEAVPTDADFKAYYDEHKNEYRVAEEYRSLEYVLFRITPSQEDMDNIAADVQRIWGELQTVENDEIGYLVSAESGHAYDSSYRQASVYAAFGLDSAIEHSVAGSLLEPRLVGNQWVMAKVLDAQMRPDSLRASAIYIMNNRMQGITRSEEQAQSLADSVLTLIRKGMPFDTAVVRFSDSKENMGDMNWADDGGYGFLNEDIIGHKEGDVFLFERPDKAGSMIVKVTGKTTPRKKYRVAVINRPIVPSGNTDKKIYNEANQFAASYRTAQALEEGVREQNRMLSNSDVIAITHNMDGHNNVREIVRWAFDKNTKKGDVAEQVFSLDGDAYVVVALKDIVAEGIPTLEQLKENPQFLNYVALDKKAAILLEKASQVKGNDIATAAAKLGTTVDSVYGVNFGSAYLDRFGAEPRVIGAIAAAKQGKMVGPVKGYSGVYLVQIDNQTGEKPSAEELEMKAANVRAQLDQLASQKLNRVVYMLKENSKVTDNRALHF